MRHGSLFSGIGGFDLAAEWMGWENKFHCEWNEFGQKVLKYYWPNSESFSDITKTDFTKYANKIDILTGGFPCQPYSQAGKRLGKEDDRHLWPEMLRAIREVKPSWVVGENVYGLVNWNGGLVFHEVQSEGWDEIRSKSERYSQKGTSSDSNNNGFYATKNRQGLGKGNDYNTARKNKTIKLKRCSNEKSKIVTNTTKQGLERLRREERRCTKLHTRYNENRGWETFPTVSPICNGDDGFSNRLDSITFPKWRNESIKAGGNAIVPQVVYQIFKAIEQYEHQRPSNTTNR